MKRTKQRRPAFVVTVSILASISGCTPSEASSSGDAMNEAGAAETGGEAGVANDAAGACGACPTCNPPGPYPGDCPKDPPTPGMACTPGGGACDYVHPPSLDAGPSSCGSTACDHGAWCGPAIDPACVYTEYFPTVSWHPPVGFHQGKCSDAQVSAFIDCLSGLPDAATCKTFSAANTACVACASTPLTAAAYGPLLEGTVTIAVNEPGCVALASGDSSPTGCGAKLAALSQCEVQACTFNSPIPDAPPPVKCWADADQTVCKAFADDAKCATALEAPGGVAAECVQSGATFTDNATAMINLFCGAPITDGGDGG
jgi:hypothetical protein